MYLLAVLYQPFTNPTVIANHRRPLPTAPALSSFLSGFPFFFGQIGIPVDPLLLYATSRPASNENQQIDRSEKGKGTTNAVGDGNGDIAMADADDNVNVNVNEADLGGFEQLSVVEAMLDRGHGLEAGLQGVAMTR